MTTPRFRLRMPLFLGLTLMLTACPGPKTSDDDAGAPDAGRPDAGSADAGLDAGSPDAGPPDAGPPDAGPPDAGPPGVGSPCTLDNECTVGSSPFCEAFPATFPNGYCTGLCAQSSDCGSSATCLPSLLSQGDGGTVSACVETCTTNSDCNAGYVCLAQGSASVCLPNNCNFVSTLCTAAQTCEATTGLCAESGYPAAFPNFAQLPQVATAGGPVLASPVLVPIFFANDDDPTASIADISAYYEHVGDSMWWSVLTEYGIGKPTVTPIMLTGSSGQAPSAIDDTPNCGRSSCTDSPLQSWLASLIDNQTDGMPPVSANTLYILNFPSTTTITENGETLCTGIGGYHYQTFDQINGQYAAYAVIPRCAAPGGQFSTDLDLLTSTASHEMAEGSSDPFPVTQPAWVQADNPYFFLSEATDQSEIGDMCEDDPEAFFEFSDFPYIVQRVWSNAAANAGHDPCVPAYPGETYFNSLPETPDTDIPFDFENQTDTVSGTQIASGATGTVTLDLYSDYPMNAWNVEVVDFNNEFLGGTALLSFTQSASKGRNGDQIAVSVTVNGIGGAGNQQVPNTELFAVYSSTESGANLTAHVCFGVVGN